MKIKTKPDIAGLVGSSIHEASRALVEKALEMRQNAYYSKIEAELLSSIIDDIIEGADSEAESAWDRKEIGSKLILFQNRLARLVTDKSAQAEKATERLVQEITDRKLVEASLRHNSDKIRVLLKSTAEAIYSLDLSGACTFANPACVRMLRYETPQALHNKNMHNLIHHTRADGSPYPGEECLIYHAFRKGEEVHVDNEVLWRADGTCFPAEYWSYPMKDDSGKVTGAVVTLLDITERKKVEWELERSKENLGIRVEERAEELAIVNKLLHHEIAERINTEEALQESKERYRALAEYNLDSVFSVSPEGKFVSANKACELNIGYTSLELEGLSSFNDLAPDDEKQKCASMFLKAMAGKSYNFETAVIHKEGHRIELDIIVVPIFVNKKVVGVHGIARDITMRKQKEMELLLAKEEAEETNRLKDKFVSIVAHDLKSPFTAITGSLALLNTYDQNPLGEEQKELIGEALASCDNMVRMIDEMLDISRLTTGSVTLQPSFMNGRVIGDLAFASHGFLAAEKKIAFTNEIPNDTRLYADQRLFEQVIQNLVSNAVKFCEPGGYIRLFVPAGRASTIAVENSGRGVISDFIDDLFRHDVKTTIPGTCGERGTGLGLPYSADIMEAHGGLLTMENDEGIKTVFYANLPVVRPSVMIIDDEKIVLELIKTQLGGLNVGFIEASDGKEAMYKLKLTTPHLIVCDIMMPKIDGFAFIKKVRRDPKTKSTPIIVITSDTSMKTRELAFQLGADDFITKPIMSEDFLPRVKRFVG